MARNQTYQRAEQKIEEARRSEAKGLDLSVGWDAKDSDKLTELPESLIQLTQLQSLSLSSNRLTALPEWLSQLTQLQYLNLSGNQLTALPKWLGKLSKLEELKISGNQLTALPEVLGQLTQLQSLSAGGQKLQSLHDGIGNLKNLRELRLSGGTETKNDFDKLPPVIRRLKKLELLWVEASNLNSLPDWIGELEELRDLQLYRNRLVDLPVSITRLDHLEKLSLDENPLNSELAAVYKEGIDAIKRYLCAKAEAQVVLNEAKLILIGEGEVGKSCLLDALRNDPFEGCPPTTHGIEIKPVKVTDPDTGTEITFNAWDFGGQMVYRPTHQFFFTTPAVYLIVWNPRNGPQVDRVKEWIGLVNHREPDAKILVVATHGGPKERQSDIDRWEIWDLFGKDTVIDFLHVDSKPPNYDKNTRQWKGTGKGINELKDAIARVSTSLPEVGRTVPKRWQDVREVLKQTDEAYLSLDRVLTICTEHKMSEEEAQDFVRISHRLGHLIHYSHDPRLKEMVILKPDWLATAVSFVLEDYETHQNHGLVTFSRLYELWSDKERAPEFRYAPELYPMFLALMEGFYLSYRVSDSQLDGQSDQMSLIAQLIPDVRPEAAFAREWIDQPEARGEEQIQICRIVDQKGQPAKAEGLFHQLIVRLHKYSLGRKDFKASVHWQRGFILDDDSNGRALLEQIGNDVRITVRAVYPGHLLALLTREVKWIVENFWKGLKCQVIQPGIELGDKPSIELLLSEGFADMRARLEELRLQNLVHDQNLKRIMSQVEDAFRGVMQTITDEGKDGPRLFSLEPVERAAFNPNGWVKKKFRVTLWCEHTRLPLPLINKHDKEGVYEFDVTREWFAAAAPFLKVLVGTLSLVLPVAASATKLAFDEATYKGFEKQLDLGKASADAMLKASDKTVDWLAEKEGPDAERTGAIHAQGGVLRQFQAWLKQADPGFGDLRKVLNKQKEFLWVHRDFEKEY